MEPFLGQISLFAFDYVPQGWAPCDGRLLQITQYQALYALLGIRFGGNGTTTFGLPDLRGRAALGADQLSGPGAHPIGQVGGQEAVQLTAYQIPTHVHALCGTTAAADAQRPADALLATTAASDPNIYANPAGPLPKFAPTALGPSGSNAGHENRQPFLAMTWAIALVGIWPPRN